MCGCSPPPSVHRMSSRPLTGGCLVVVVVAGLAARTLPGPVGDFLGGVLYAVAVGVVVSLVVPRTRPWVSSAVGVAVSCGVEGMQALGVSRSVVRVVPAARWVLGTTFVPADLVAYAAGGVVTFVLLSLLRRWSAFVRAR